MQTKVPPSASERLAGRRRRILVVDDHVELADTLCGLLGQLGYEAVAAYDGASALTSALTFHPDVVVLDLKLPDVHGDEVCRRLREQCPESPLEIIALTGSMETLELEREGCFDRCLRKPVGASVLLDLLGS
jgi:CheY-like chemotaxis protein